MWFNLVKKEKLIFYYQATQINETTENLNQIESLKCGKGSNLTLTATETAPAPTLDSATETAFLAIVESTQINP